MKGLHWTCILRVQFLFFPHVILVGDKFNEKAHQPEVPLFFLIIYEGDDRATI